MPKKSTYWSNPEKYRKASRDCNRKRYKEDPIYKKKQAIKTAIWKKTTPKGRYSTLKRNSRRRNLPLRITQEEFIRWYENELSNCYYCNKFEKKENLEIERLNNIEPYKLGNIKFTCHNCNSVKGEILTEKEMLIVGKLVMEKRWKTKTL